MPEKTLISKFKGHRAAELKKVTKTERPSIVTLRGKTLFHVEPIVASSAPAVRLGTKRGKAKLKRDLVKFDFSKEWEIEKEWSRMRLNES